MPKKGTVKKVSQGYYKVSKSSAKEKEVILIKPVNKKAKTFSIPATVSIQGYTYKVTEITPKAFNNSKNLQAVTIGKNVKKIGKEAFLGCKKLKKITIKSTVLKSVGTNTIKGINKKAVIKCPKKQLKKYQKLFGKKSGYQKGMKLKK